MTDNEKTIISFNYLERWQGGLTEEDKRELAELRAKARRENKRWTQEPKGKRR